MSYIQTILKTYNYSKDLISHCPLNTFESVQDIFSHKTLKNQRHFSINDVKSGAVHQAAKKLDKI